MTNILIRETTAADAEAIARVHVDSWRESYAGLVPADYLSNISWEKRAENWKNFHEKEGPGIGFVAEAAGTVKGFVTAGKSQKSDFGIDGELYTLYLLKQAQGCGIGRKLFEKARNSLALSGINGMYLWVFKDNPALAFYQHMGGQELSRQTVTIGGADLEEIALVWK
jgi:ribosomal protein S18 acetylase RimI-like enzyme